MSMIYRLFPTPVWRTKIEKTEYDKDKIVEEILYNFNLDPKRNNWGNKSSIWHHSYNDVKNSNFKEISYKESGLIDRINEKMQEFVSLLNLKNPVNYNFEITNYTVAKEGYFMANHAHHGDDFTSVLYLKYDKKTHPSTRIMNPSNDSVYLKRLQPLLFDSSNHQSLDFSYFHEFFHIETEEDDLIVFPSHIMHQVPLVRKTDTPRITISINMRLVE